VSRRPDPRTLERTPRLSAGLARLDQSLTRAAHLHGLGTLLAATALWLGFAFVADYYLGVPYGVRLFHLAVLLLGIVFLARWAWLRPLGRRPDLRGLALLAERCRPQQDELLVSAVEFQLRPESARSSVESSPELRAELIERVYRAADQAAAGLRFEAVLDRRGPRQRFLLGLLGSAALTAAALAAPQQAAIFAQRLFGGLEPWPQRTQLTLEVRAAEGRVRIERENDARGELLRVSLPRGSDLPILVSAAGELPSEVWLDFDDGQRSQLAPSGPASFATVLRGLTADLAFSVRGGDDRDGRPRLLLTVLEPPDILATLLEIVPPPYSGLPAEQAFDRGSRALLGSRVRVSLLPSGEGVRGQVRLLPEDRVLELTTAEFPSRAEAEGTLALGGSGLAFEFELAATTHLRFELVDARGLTNPDPGLLSIEAQADEPPQIAIAAPTRNEIETVASAVLPLRASATDDFGLTSAGFELRRGDSDDWQTRRTLELSPAPPPEPGEAEPAQRRPRARAWLRQRLELAELERWTRTVASGPAAVGDAPSGAGEAPADGGTPEGPALAPGSSFVLELFAADNRNPAQVGRSSSLRVRVLSDDEFLRRVQDRLADARQKADALTQAQTERRQRVEELLGALAEEGPGEALDSRGLSAALNGQRRVEGDAEALLRELASVAESVLHARLEAPAEAWSRRLEELGDKRAGARFDSAPWRTLAAEVKAAGAASTLSGHLLELVDLARRVGEEGAASATLALSQAADLNRRPADQRQALVSALEHQRATLQRLEDLLERLKEWDNFQSVLSLTRDILNRQKALQERLKQHAAK
jgi:hypothetical protein